MMSTPDMNGSNDVNSDTESSGTTSLSVGGSGRLHSMDNKDWKSTLQIPKKDTRIKTTKRSPRDSLRLYIPFCRARRTDHDAIYRSSPYAILTIL
ncbi:unnamed protein product [Didymodactylos carnosus]|uniref:Uncharacterized protein n=1 Tax=Didymodactylos carnosus TaxID=1234261 RepID=A0A8S2Q7G2_9BILA|nr:unnamed protein product [Didymodactylos carnosus]CAF4085203.1 unnamed protein product [Didymodactylos carnosus]